MPVFGLPSAGITKIIGAFEPAAAGPCMCVPVSALVRPENSISYDNMWVLGSN